MSTILPMIISPEPLLRLGLRHFLREHHMPHCLEAESKADARRLMAEHAPGLVIIAGVEGREDLPRLMRDLRRQRRGLPFLVLCRSQAPEQVRLFLQADGCAYITYEDALAEVSMACASVLRGGLHVSRPLARSLQGYLGAGKAARSLVKRPASGFSAREQEVFDLVGDGCGCKEIAGKLGISVKTVETHQMRMKQKLGVERSSELRRLAQDGASIIGSQRDQGR